MALALARKYRPRSFDDLVGQETVSRTLAQALDGNRLSHAYLFSGLRGSGKTSTARIFAKALLCEKGPASTPCEECVHCQMANENRHMDIIEMDAASNRGIDDIKELIEHTKYQPGSGRFKIFIIDEVHMLTTQAFNALLKTLEEPPEFVKFILATTDPLKLPATILSRTQHFRFKKIPAKLVRTHLEHILNLEQVEYDPEAIEIIARSGAGSLRDSLTLLDQAIVYARGRVDLPTVTGMLGIIDPAVLDGLLDRIAAKDEQAILDFVAESGAYETEMILDELTLHLKESLLTQDPRFSPLILDRFFRILAESKELLSLGSDGEFVLSLALFKMIEALSIREIDEMIRTLQKELSGVVPAASSTQSAPSAPAASAPSEKEIDASAILETPSRTEPEPERTQERSEEAPAAQPTTEDTGALKFRTLIEKLYDRDYSLGECFERNIRYRHFADGALTWESAAQGEEKKTLVRHWGIIRMFVQELFGLETRIVNIPKETPHEDPSPSQERQSESAEPTPSSPTLQNGKQGPDEESEASMKSSCIAPDPGDTEAAKEKDPSTLLEEPMIKEAIALFDPKKVRIKRKS